MEVHALDNYYLAITLLITVAYQLLFFSIAFTFKFDKLTGLLLLFPKLVKWLLTLRRLRWRHQFCRTCYHHPRLLRESRCASGCRLAVHHAVGRAPLRVPVVPYPEDR